MTKTELSNPTNEGKTLIETCIPYTVNLQIQGVSDFLFHRWNPEAVDEKASAAKGSVTKKTDNIESYVYRTEDGELAIPGEYVRQAIISAAKFRQDPRSPRKSAMDLYKAGIVTSTNLASVGKSTWDYEDRRRVVVQRAGVNRTRPALKAGWKADFDLICLLPEYISPPALNEVVSQAGRLVGLGDFRPTYGRFVITRFEVIQE